jgi:hypothetical protein
MGVGWRSAVIWQSPRIVGFQGDVRSVRGVQVFVRISEVLSAGLVSPICVFGICRWLPGVFLVVSFLVLFLATCSSVRVGCSVALLVLVVRCRCSPFWSGWSCGSLRASCSSLLGICSVLCRSGSHCAFVGLQGSVCSMNGVQIFVGISEVSSDGPASSMCCLVSFVGCCWFLVVSFLVLLLVTWSSVCVGCSIALLVLVVRCRCSSCWSSWSFGSCVRCVGLCWTCVASCFVLAAGGWCVVVLGDLDGPAGCEVRGARPSGVGVSGDVEGFEVFCPFLCACV